MLKNQMRRGHNFIRLGLHGRLMKDDVPGGGTPQGGGDNGDNGSGNSGGGGGDSQNPNNTGQEFNPDTFWTGSDQSGESSLPGSSAGPSGADSNTSGDSGNEFQTQLTQRLENMDFGEPIFTAEIAEQINNGDFTGVQERLNSSMQSAVRNALAMNVQILRPFAEQMMDQMRQEIQQTLSGREANATLEQDFPAARNPTARPMIQMVFDQAMKNAKGDRNKAVAMTKDMIKSMAGVTASDLGVTVAPRSELDNSPQNRSVNWLEELDFQTSR